MPVKANIAMPEKWAIQKKAAGNEQGPAAVQQHKLGS